jgi:hypothetical protein
VPVPAGQRGRGLTATSALAGRDDRDCDQSDEDRDDTRDAGGAVIDRPLIGRPRSHLWDEPMLMRALIIA